MFISVIFWFFGLFLTIFTIVSILISVFFAIPYTKKLTKAKWFKRNNPIVKNYLIHILTALTAYTVVTILVYSLSTDASFKGFIGGSIFAVIIGIWRVNPNEDTIQDYFDTNSKYVTENNDEKITLEQVNQLPFILDKQKSESKKYIYITIALFIIVLVGYFL